MGVGTWLSIGNRVKLSDLFNSCIICHVPGTKRFDVTGTVLTFTSSLASTYLKNFLTKKKAAVISVQNLSDDYFVTDGCEAGTTTHIGSPPG